jgi:hypothetical protein
MIRRPVDQTRRSTLSLLGASILGSSVASRAWALGGAVETPAPPPWDETLGDLHRRTFNYFRDSTAADTGLAPDNWPHPIFSSIAAIGHYLTALCIGVKSTYMERSEAARRARAALEQLWRGPQSDARSGVTGDHGFFYHFLDTKTGLRFRNTELSTVDTSMLVLGALTAAAYFDRDTDDERRIQTLGLALYTRLDWNFVLRRTGLVSMGWLPEKAAREHPETGLIERNWDRYNEGMMVLLLCLGREEPPAHPDAWANWAKTIDGTFGKNFGEPHLGFSPMLGHQYSHCWFDFRGLADPYMASRGLTYFENSRRAAYAQRNYAILNPGRFHDYGPDVWGLTACQGPGEFKATMHGRKVTFHGYYARGPQTGDGESIDDGTLAPTAGAASIAFAPEIVIPLIHSLRARYGDDIYGEYGFYDAFNPSVPRMARLKRGRMTKRAGWVADQYLGIDQGPILLMLENYRSGFVWDLFCRSPLTGSIARRAFTRAGFRPTAPSGQWLMSA